MKNTKNSFIIVLAMVFATVISCKDLTELNLDPNGVPPETADVNTLLPTIETNVGGTILGLGFGDIAGVMQHTQKDGWPGGHNNYDWNTMSHSWNGYYGILRNIEEYYKKSVDGGYEFHQGAALVFKAYTFGLIADLWGDAPYTDAGKAEQGPEYFAPKFDPQQEIYHGIIADLETANTLLSKNADEYSNINPAQDVLYNGNVAKWRKFANSIALRYYMRLSVKEPVFAEAGIKKITGDGGKYPLITNTVDDANIGYPGKSAGDSWPTNTVFDISPSGSYFRIKMCSTLVEKLQSLNDPRLGVWANKVGTPQLLVGGTNVDRIVDGKREISADIAAKYVNQYGPIDYDQEYVGLVPSFKVPTAYNNNLSNAGTQGVYNPHVSQLSDIYKEVTGDLLQIRLISAAEVNFILAEAAWRGWISGAEDYYAQGIQQSFNAWGTGNAATYIAEVPYAGLESIITQKWIASWSAAAEAWFDWRRTGIPELHTGEMAVRDALPLRFYYHQNDEIEKNKVNAEAAIAKLEPTQFKGNDQTNNSAWSKMWVLQGTGKPY